MGVFKEEIGRGFAKGITGALFSPPAGDVTQTTSGGTTTQRRDVSDEDVEKLLTQKLSSLKGLAEVSSGSRSPGLYNTTVQTLLTNDLLSKAAVEVALARAPVVTEKAPTVTKRDVKEQSLIEQLAPAGVAIIGGVVGDLISESLEGVFDFAPEVDVSDEGFFVGTPGSTGGSGPSTTSFQETTRRQREDREIASGESEGTSGGCFITTAVCELHSKPDDCQELRILRDFRDTFMKDNYPELVEQYYREAPGIAKALTATDAGIKLLGEFLTTHIKPAISSILRDKSEAALETYAEMFSLAKDTANLG